MGNQVKFEASSTNNLGQSVSEHKPKIANGKMRNGHEVCIQGGEVLAKYGDNLFYGMKNGLR